MEMWKCCMGFLGTAHCVLSTAFDMRQRVVFNVFDIVVSVIVTVTVESLQIDSESRQNTVKNRYVCWGTFRSAQYRIETIHRIYVVRMYEWNVQAQARAKRNWKATKQKKGV